MENNMPVIGTYYQRGCQVRKIINIKYNRQGPADIIYLVPGNDRVVGQWYPLWEEWAREAVILQ